MDQAIPSPQGGTPARITKRFRPGSTAGPVEHLKTGCGNQHRLTPLAETLASAQPDPTRPPPSPHPPARSVTMVGADELAGVLGGAGAESRFLTASDGVRLHYLYWPSRPSPPWAVLIFLHGIASHAGWFSETAAHLNQHGVAVYGPDRRGSGRSGGPRGHLARYERALDDLEQLVQLVGSEHPGTPVFLAASSWAAKLAVVYVAQRPTPLSGLVLPAPVLQSRVKVSPGFRIRVLVGHLAAPMTYLPIPLTPEQYTANLPYRNVMRADALRLLEATAQLFWETVRLDRRRRRAAARLGLPLLVLHGEEDPMLDVPKTHRWFEQLGVEDKTYRAYPGVGHGLDFAPDRAEYLADLLGWLSARISPQSPRTGGGP
jgi:alpha-beta hydrolase superfamily lysophospholipase